MPVQQFNLVEIVTDVLKARSHPTPTKWQAGLDVTAMSRLPFSMQCKIVTDRIHGIVGPVLPEVRSLLKNNKGYEDWLFDFETNIACVMAEHNL